MNRKHILLLALLAAAGCATPPKAPSAPPPVAAVMPQPAPEKPTFSETGMASWYGRKLQHRKTASGERFDTTALTAAHRTLPFQTIARVTELNTGTTVKVRITDRGPHTKDRVIDVSKAAASALGMGDKGHVRVEVFASDQSP